MSVKRTQRGWRLKAYHGENIQDMLVTGHSFVLLAQFLEKTTTFYCCIISISYYLRKSLFLTHLASGLSNIFILSHKELCV